MYKLSLMKPNNLLRCGLLLLIVKVLLSCTSLINISGTIDTGISLLAAVMFFVVIIQKRYSVKALIALILTCLVAFVTSLKVGNWTLFISILTMLSIADTKGSESFDDVIRFIFQYELIIFVGITVTALCASFFGYNLLTRISADMCVNFGFSHPNVFSCLLLNLILMWIWLNFDSMKSKHYLIIFAVIAVFTYFTGTRTLLLAGILLLVLCGICLKNGKAVRLVHTAAQFCIPVLTAIIWASVLGYRKGWGWSAWLNEALSGRIRLGAYAYEHFGATVLGQQVEQTFFGWDESWGMSMFTTFDNLYTKLIINFGIVWLAAVIVCFFILAGRKNKKANMMIILWAVYSVVEGHGMNGYMFFPILLAADLFSTRSFLAVSADRADGAGLPAGQSSLRRIAGVPEHTGPLKHR